MEKPIRKASWDIEDNGEKVLTEAEKEVLIEHPLRNTRKENPKIHESQ